MTVEKFSKGNADYRRQQAASVGRMILTIFAAAHHNYAAVTHNDDHVGRLMQEWLVLFAIRVSEQDKKPMTISRLARYLRMPRSNVERAVDDLLKRGVIEPDGKSYVSGRNYLERTDLNDWRHIHEAVIRCASELNH